MELLNLKRLFGRKYRVVYEPRTDVRTSEFYQIPCLYNAYIAPYNSTECVAVYFGNKWDETREKLREFPVVKDTRKLIMVAFLPSEIDTIAELMRPEKRVQLVRVSKWGRSLVMPPIPKPLKAMAA